MKFLTNTLVVLKIAMLKRLKIYVLGKKRASARCTLDKQKVINILRNIPETTRTDFYRNICFISNLMNIVYARLN